VAGFGAWLLAGAALRTSDQDARRLANITEHDTGARLRVPGTGDEVASLAEAMNGLLDRLQRALARQRVLSPMPATSCALVDALKAELELAARPGRDRETLNNAISRRGRHRATDPAGRGSLLLARADEGAKFLLAQPIVLSIWWRTQCEAQWPLQPPARISRTDADPTMRIVGDPDRLRQVVGNCSTTHFATP